MANFYDVVSPEWLAAAFAAPIVVAVLFRAM